MKRSKLKKRLRKKFHFGEFQEFGFEIIAHLKAGLNETEFDNFTDDFILYAIEKNQLSFGGGGSPTKWEGFVTSSKKYCSATETQRVEVIDWLKNREEVVDYKISELRDGWNG